MANSRFFLDTRRTKDGSTSLLKVAIAHQGQTAYIPLDTRLLSSQWDADKAEVINHPDMKFLNIRIRGIRCQVDKMLLLLADSGQLARMTALDVKSHIEDELHPEKAEEKKRKLEKELIETKMERINRIKAVLAETERTSKWLAEQLDKDPATVSKWCTNTSQPDLYTLTRVAELLDVDIRSLLRPTKPMNALGL